MSGKFYDKKAKRWRDRDTKAFVKAPRDGKPTPSRKSGKKGAKKGKK